LRDVTQNRAAFSRLHEAGCFLMPNPWDAGSARYLRHLGFQALATTSSGFAFSRGLPDDAGAVGLDIALEHIALVVSAADLPLNADFQAGYADEPEALGENVRRCVQTGVAGLSIEDATGNPAKPLYEMPLAVERIKAARAAIDAAGPGVLLTARAECYLVGQSAPLDESVRRLQAYAEAGADVLFAPGPTDPEHIRRIVEAVAPKPVNLLMSSKTPLSFSDLMELGVRRISVGSALARVAWSAFIRAAKALAEEGSFAGFEGLVSFDELNEFFKTNPIKKDP